MHVIQQSLILVHTYCKTMSFGRWCTWCFQKEVRTFQAIRGNGQQHHVDQGFCDCRKSPGGGIIRLDPVRVSLVVGLCHASWRACRLYIVRNWGLTDEATEVGNRTLAPKMNGVVSPQIHDCRVSECLLECRLPPVHQTCTWHKCSRLGMSSVKNIHEYTHERIQSYGRLMRTKLGFLLMVCVWQTMKKWRIRILIHPTSRRDCDRPSLEVSILRGLGDAQDITCMIRDYSVFKRLVKASFIDFMWQFWWSIVFISDIRVTCTIYVGWTELPIIEGFTRLGFDQSSYVFIPNQGKRIPRRPPPIQESCFAIHPNTVKYGYIYIYTCICIYIYIIDIKK